MSRAVGIQGSRTSLRRILTARSEPCTNTEEKGTRAMNRILTISIFVVLAAACSKQNEQTTATTQPAAQAAAPAATPTKIDVPAGAYTLDKAHSSLVFRVNHLG